MLLATTKAPYYGPYDALSLSAMATKNSPLFSTIITSTRVSLCILQDSFMLIKPVFFATDDNTQFRLETNLRPNISLSKTALTDDCYGKTNPRLSWTLFSLSLSLSLISIRGSGSTTVTNPWCTSDASRPHRSLDP